MNVVDRHVKYYLNRYGDKAIQRVEAIRDAIKNRGLDTTHQDKILTRLRG